MSSGKLERISIAPSGSPMESSPTDTSGTYILIMRQAALRTPEITLISWSTMVSI